MYCSNAVKKWLGYYNGKATIYSGTGYLQGMGVDIELDVFEIRRFGIRIIKDIKFSANSEWLRDLKERMVKDDIQQKTGKK